jgi:hypothetical protein
MLKAKHTSPSLFAWLISHQPTVLFSHNKPATSNQPAVLFSQNKPASATSQTNRVTSVENSNKISIAGGPLCPPPTASSFGWWLVTDTDFF